MEILPGNPAPSEGGPVDPHTLIPELVVLDLDGTLAELVVDWEQVRAQITDALAPRGLRPKVGLLRTIGSLDKAGEHEAADEVRAIIRAAEVEAASRARFNAPLLEWLERTAPDAAVGLLAINDREAVLAIAARTPLGGRIRPEYVIGRDDATPKPDPAGLKQIIAASGCEPERTLMIGDAPSDLDCAHEAGVAYLDVMEIGLDFGAES